LSLIGESLASPGQAASSSVDGALSTRIGNRRRWWSFWTRPPSLVKVPQLSVSRPKDLIVRDRPSFSLVVPVYNEEERFAERAQELADFIRGFPIGSELLVVDDGSTDRTAEVVEAFLAGEPDLRAKLLRRRHEGKGSAVRVGLEAATAEYAGFCDVDLSTPPDQLERILRSACAWPVLAIGSRQAPASRLLRRQHPVREWLGKGYNGLVQLVLTPGIADTQCGAKVAATSLWARILPWSREPHLAWDVEIVAIARRLGIEVQEVAVEWANDHRTRVRLGRDGVAMVAAVPRIVRTVHRLRPGSTGVGAAGRGGVFDDRQAATLSESDTRHWWFRSKGGFVAAAIRHHVPEDRRDGYLVDVGAGAGGVTVLLGWPHRRLVAVDGSESLAGSAHRRHSVLAAVGLGERLPVREGSVALVTLLDVIEHLRRQDQTLREAWRVLAPGGHLVVTVPAHGWLWSGADELLGHVRRYTRPLLRSQLAEAGFRPLYMSHVFSWLVVPVLLQRRLATTGERQLGLDRRSPLLDGVALVLTRLELAVVRRLSLPMGTSIICVAVKERSERRS
jgi:dolichyl-phosphate beta-glucosyltransferase